MRPDERNVSTRQRAGRGARPSWGAGTVWVLLTCLLAAGCGADAEDQPASETASAFAGSVADDPVAACDLLAPGTRQTLEEDAGADCATALRDADLPAPSRRLSAERSGHSALVRFTGDTIFLALFDSGWRVVAAGCQRADADPAVPYDCAVEGS